MLGGTMNEQPAPDPTVARNPADDNLDAGLAAAFGPDLQPVAAGLSLPHDSLARYQLHGEIARGGMGAILRALDVDLRRDIAVKVLLETHADNPDWQRRFVEEAQIAGQ